FLQTTHTWRGLIEQIAKFENRDEFDCFFDYLRLFKENYGIVSTELELT
ncbi:cell division protein FtsL, partial [Neisseria macacae ATCC 33926]